MANRKTTVLAVMSLVAGGLLIIYLIKRDDLRNNQRTLAGDGEFSEAVPDEPSEMGTFKRLEISDGNSLVIEDASGKELSFVCYDNCSPLDENTDSYVGKRLRVYWLATSDDQDASQDAMTTPAVGTQERIAVRIELLGQ